MRRADLPDLKGAACRKYFSPGFWAAGASPDEREAARWICSTACPVLEACRTLALGLPGTVQGTIAGLSQVQRQRIRRERRAQEAAELEREAERLEALRARRRRAEALRRRLGKAPSAEERRKAYAASPEAQKARSRDYYARNREKVLARIAASDAARRRASRQKAA